MKNIYVPVDVVSKRKNKTWYVDVSNLSLGELIELKKELLGTSSYGIRYIDKLIYEELHKYTAYDDSDNTYCKEVKRDKKVQKRKLSKCKEKKWRK